MKQKIATLAFALSAMGALLSCQVQTDKAPQTSDSNSPDASLPTDTPIACKQAQYRQMDFWLGEWDLSWTNADGTMGTGVNIISKEPFDDCVIMERFDGEESLPLQGLSVSTYSAPQGLWRQTWVDNSGGYFSLYGGPIAGGTFALEGERINDKGPYLRMVWEDITDDNLTWRWQGRTSPDEAWADRWVIYYERK